MTRGTADLDPFLEAAPPPWVVRGLSSLLLALAGLGGGLIVTQTDHPRSRGAHDLQRIARALGLEAAVAPTTAQALAEALRGAHDDDLVLVTGSLSIVGEARRELGLTVE